MSLPSQRFYWQTQLDSLLKQLEACMYYSNGYYKVKNNKWDLVDGYGSQNLVRKIKDIRGKLERLENVISW
jgi:hypothetical protein